MNTTPAACMIPWDNLADLRSRGLQVLAVNILQDAQTELVVNMPEELMQELKPKTSKLAGLLSSMLQKAQPGVAQKTVLPGGMGIDLIMGSDGMFRLQIWRRGQPPSLVEWRTTLANLPYELSGDPQEQFAAIGNHYLRSAWPINDLQLKQP